MENDDGCNALLLPARNKKRKMDTDDPHAKSKAPKLSKNQQRKLRRLQEEMEKKEKNVEILATLEKYKLADNAYALLQSSSRRGQRESMREKLRRALHYERAGLKIPIGVPLLCEKSTGEDLHMVETRNMVASCTRKHGKGNGVQLDVKEFKTCIDHSNGSMESFESGAELFDSVQCASGEQQIKRKSSLDGGRETLCTGSSSLVDKLVNGRLDDEKKSSSVQGRAKEVLSLPPKKPERLHNEHQDYNVNDLIDRKTRKKRKQEKGRKLGDLNNRDSNKGDKPCEEGCDTVRVDGSTFDKRPKIVVHVSRTDEVKRAREKLPIIMMEQEIMEAIDENPVTIVCGETGCGKTTQVPQFLYEAGFSSSACLERAGMIGVTQPRRIAVLATAKRLAHEMNLNLGEEVGFQVRHDRKIGDKSCIKFMTDGILLRELQSDFLLRKYSVIVLDEAHERSLNTDVLIGMLSRVLPLRQSLYEEQYRSGKAFIFPLKLVIMSATLLVDDFVGNRKLFASQPPVVQVPARQFPVTLHFSSKTELVDYVGKSFKKVCAIHKNLPPGGVLVFLTGQAEVHYLCKRLEKAFQKEGKNQRGKHPDRAEKVLGDITEAADASYAIDEFDDENEMALNWEIEDTSLESSSDSDLEFSEVENTPLGKPSPEGGSEWTVEGSLCLDSIKDAFDSFTGTGNWNDSKTKDDSTKLPSVKKPKDPGPLNVLPLYALLPAAAQLKVFGAVPEGSRLVVVATNVAETSITIPGIRYVVDCGRVKEKIFERACGITRYEVGWISKASAAQRAGRSGRTGPGHCYRLYSSAIFNDTFPEFSRPEIYRSPIEGLVLLLKSMNIVKVNHFPFISEPDKTALVEAEQCLHALSALDSDTGLLTPLGQALSLYPISPRHGRMLLTAMQIGSSDDIKETSVLLAYAGATVAALSLDRPFMMDVAQDVDNGVSAKPGEQSVVSTQSKKFLGRKTLPMARFRHPFSDALGIVGALRAYELSHDPEVFCNENHLHSRILYEMSKLRKQLIHIYLVFSKEREVKGICICNGVTVADVEAAWKSGTNSKLSTKHENVLRQAICAGWADRVAHKVNLQEILKSSEQGDHKKRKAIPYQTCNTEEKVYIHPSSSLRKNVTDFVVFSELVRTSKPYMKVVTSVDAHWLVLYGRALCTFSKPLSDPPPWYDSVTDDVYCWVSTSFGPHLWQLPLNRFPLKSKKHRIAVFACAFLQGEVLPSMATLCPHLAADPSILLVPSGHAHKRASELLHVLEAASVDSRCKLEGMWDNQSGFLYQEILLWIQKKSHPQLDRLWTRLQLEAQQDGKSLYGKRKRKQCLE